MSNVASNAIRAAVEIQTRKIDSLALFRPLPHQEEALLQFVKDSVVESLVGGGQRGGKSLFITAVMASMLRDIPITLTSGQKIHVRPERWRGKELLVWAIGYDWSHIGTTMYSLLFRGGQFDIIKDQDTGEWRSYDPRSDASRSSEKRGAPAFIPSSAIEPDSWAWESRRLRQLRSVEFLKDKSRLIFYPSTAEVATGQPVNFIWIDENLDNTDHYAEWMMRITQFSGKIAWTAWPSNVPSALMTDIQDRGLADRESENPKSLYFQFKGSNNPHVQSETRDFALTTMSDDEREARDSGVLNRDSWLMYPRFSRRIHSVNSVEDRLSLALEESGGIIPPSWTRYLALDPGTTNPAVLLAAVPPSSIGDFIVPYAEIAIPRLDADQLAQKVAELTYGQKFQAFIVDGRAYRQTPPGLSFSIGDNYARAFAQRSITCVESGSSFTPGSDVPEARIGQLQAWMAIRSDGTTKLRIHNCPVLCKQIEIYMKAAGPDRKPTEKPSKRQHIDVATCLEYIASRSPRYIFAKKEDFTSDGMRRWNSFVSKFSGSNSPKVKCGPGVISQ